MTDDVRTSRRGVRSRLLLYAVFAVAAIAYLLGAGAPVSTGTVDGPVSGAQLFRSRCAVCHGAAGSGGIAPALSRQTLEAQFPNDGDQARFVLSGSRAGRRYGAYGRGTGGMPSFRGILSDGDVAAVVRYARGL